MNLIMNFILLTLETFEPRAEKEIMFETTAQK